MAYALTTKLSSLLWLFRLSPSFSKTDIISTQCLFEPRVIDFDGLKQGMRSSQDPGVSEDIIEIRDPRDALMEKYVCASTT